MTIARTVSYAVVVLGTILSIYAATALPVDNRLTKTDNEAIGQLNLSSACSLQDRRSFENELDCLRVLQKAVQSIGDGQCAVASDVIEPQEFLTRNYGCCFDRARFIEKAARYYGFETRRVFLIQPAFGNSLTNVLPLGQASHATSEIMTTQGWLGVDSNEPFMLIDDAGAPTTYRQALENLTLFSMLKPRPFYASKLDIIYGLYSRHGNFHGLNLPGPEYVFSELLWNWQ